MENFVRLVEAIVWPVTVLWLGLVFKGEIQKLLARVSSLKYKDVEAGFENKLADAESFSAKIETPKVSESEVELSATEQLIRISKISPRASVVEAWTLVENAAMKAGLTNGTRIPRVSPKAVTEFLESTGKLSSDSILLVNKLRRLKSKASHMPDFAISQDEAERYLNLAVKSAALIKAAES